MKKLTVSFFLKADKSKKNGKAPIYFKIKLGDESTTISTGKYITPERWKATNYLLNAKKNSTEFSLKNYIYNIDSSVLSPKN